MLKIRLLLHKFSDYGFLAIVLSVLFSAFLGSYALIIPDEGRYAEVAREMLANHDFLTPTVNGIYFFDKPILFYWLEAAAIKVFGLSEWSVRLVPVLLAILGCLFVYHSGRLLFNRRTAVLAAIILATSLLYFVSAHYVNMDLAVATFLTGALGLFISSWQLPKGRARDLHLWGAYSCAGLAVLTKGLIGIVFPMMIIGVWILFTNRWSILKQMRLFTGVLLFSIIVAPWFFLIQREHSDFFHYFFIVQHLQRYVSNTFNNQQAIWFYPLVILIGFMPWTLFLWSTCKFHLLQIIHKRQQQATQIFLILWCLLVLIFFSLPDSKPIGYILPIFAPLALLMANYLDIGLLSNPQSITINCRVMIGFAFFATLILFALPSLAIKTIPVGLNVFFYGTGSLILVLAVVGWSLTKKYTPIISLYYLAFSTALVFIIIVMAMPMTELISTRSIAKHLNKYLRPTDVVASYYSFYQDLPFYNQRYIAAISDWNDPKIFQGDGWEGQLAYGLLWQTGLKNKLLLNESTFWKKWRSAQRVFVVMTIPRYKKLMQYSREKFYPVTQDKYFIVLANQLVHD